MSQTSYGDPAVGFVGQVAETSMLNNRVTKIATESVPYGSFVCYEGTGAATRCALPAAATDVTDVGFGFAILDAARETVAGGFATEEDVPVLESGVIWLTTEDLSTVNGPVFVRHAGGTLGAVRSDADGGNATALPGARFEEARATAGLVKVRLTPQTA